MRFALGALPLFTLLIWTAALYLRDARRESGAVTLRNAVLRAAALLGLWVVVSTEALSAIDQLKFVPILILWIIAAGAGAGAVRHWYQLGSPPRIKWCWPKFLTVVAAVPFVSMLSLALASAVFNPPNNYDSYSYHLPRQVLWLQHSNVRFYPANNLRQLEMSPFAEFVGVQLMALSNSDRWTNLVQFAALLITFCGVSLLTERLGGSRAAQFLACLIVVTSPVIFMEASNTKNDIVVAMWIVMSVVWLLRALDGIAWDSLDVLLFGSALGCAADTKGTGPLFVIPIVLVLCICVLRQFSARRFRMLCAVGLVALAINLPQFGRNVIAFGHIDGPTVEKGGYPLYNQSHGINVVLSNTLRLFAWHCAIQYQPFNDAMYRDVVWLHEHVLHIGVNDPRTTTPFSSYNGLRFYGDDEDRAGSPALMLLLLLLPLALISARKRMDMSYALLIFAIAVAGFIIFNWLGKWQEWHTRYFIPQTALFASVLATALMARMRFVVLPILALLLMWGLLPTIKSNPRQLFGSGSLFNRDDLTRRFTYIGHNDDFLAVAKVVYKKHIHWVGFATGGNFPEYSIMYVIKSHLHHYPNFEYINPFVPIAGYTPHRADMVITEPPLTTLVDRATGTRYVLYRGGPVFNILLRQENPPRGGTGK
jgi:hypothetical protein